MSTITIHICHKCYEHTKALSGHTVDTHGFYVPCTFCGKRTENTTSRQYRGDEILWLEQRLKADAWALDKLERKHRTALKRIELLENHIKYMPGGEGALEALEHFTETKTEESMVSK